MNPSHMVLPPQSPTPPFVLWALEFDCIYREESQPNELERIERILRPLRASAEALAEGRCLDGICIHREWSPQRTAEQTSGFVLSDTLVPFGGHDAAERTCGNCPANAAMPLAASPRWAGCHGMLIATDLEAIELLLQKILCDVAAISASGLPLPEASLAWYRMWIDSPLSGEQLACHADIWQRFPSPDSIPGLAAFQRALAAAITHSLPLHVKAYPAGIRSRKHWQVPAHCPRCSAQRDEASHACPICRTTEGAVAARRRLAKGERPYWELTRFLGADAAEALLVRYKSVGWASPTNAATLGPKTT